MTPGNINYQAAIRDANGALIVNTSVNFQFSVISNSSTGNVVFQETQSSTSNDFGLVNLKIGNGTPVIGSISAVDWSDGPYSFKVEMDASGGTNFSLFGVSDISSVPYSLFADKAATVDSVSINQISDLPSLSISNDTIDLGSFGSLYIDGSTTNEIQDLQLNGDTLSISLNPSATKVDLSGYLDNTNLTEAQVDSFANNNGYLLTEVDGSITNEIQDLTIASNVLSITGNSTATSIDLSGYLDNTNLTQAQVDSFVNNNGYVDTTTAQTIGGAKIFSSDLTVNGITVGQGAGTGNGNGNTANGYQTLYSNTIGSNNTANGYQALKANTTGYNNTATGNAALASNTTGANNTANGKDALRDNTTGVNNTANGFYALKYNTTGYSNTANGNQALDYNTTGYYNTATGNGALLFNTTGYSNTAIGVSALYYNTTGIWNTVTGVSALTNNTTGSNNTATGYYALSTNTTGSSNTALGYGADVSAGNLTNATALGNGASVTASNTIQLGNASVTDVKTSGTITAGAITIPNTDGTANQVLTTDGSGALGWVTNDGSVTNEIQNIEEVLTTGNDANGKDIVDLGNVAIGSQSADASALLDVSSTTQGLLPPRMTQVQRNAISNPAAGLIVWCIDCGTNGLFSGYNGTGWADLSLTSTAGTVPTVTTDAITSYGFSSATLGGNVLSNSGASILSRGVCYSSSPNPNISDNITTVSTGTGAFNDFVIGLDSNTSYYARAYATNSNGIAYGNQVTFTSKGLVSIGDLFQGGIVAHIIQPGEQGYVSGEQHGLIALPYDYYATVRWCGNSSSSYQIASSLTTNWVGDGGTNTSAIFDSCVSIETGAIQMAQNLIANGYSDWHLPSFNELVIAMNNNSLANLSFSSSYYWSSTQANNAQARIVGYNSNGNNPMGSQNITVPQKARAFRYF
jgi:hypothetical protein